MPRSAPLTRSSCRCAFATPARSAPRARKSWTFSPPTRTPASRTSCSTSGATASPRCSRIWRSSRATFGHPWSARRMLPLDDVTVLDLSHALAGPFASTMLADFGAKVIKIEPPTGDIARAWGPPFYGSEPSYVVGLHRNKQSVVIDFKHEEGKALFFKLIERADVVLENYRVGVIDKLGLGYEAAKAR